MNLYRITQNVRWVRNALPEYDCDNVPHSSKIAAEPLAASLWVLLRILQKGSR